MVSEKLDQQSWTISPPDREQTPPPQFPAPPAFTEEDDGTSSMEQVEHAFPKVENYLFPILVPLQLMYTLSPRYPANQSFI